MELSPSQSAVLDTIRGRRSIRQYLPQPVEENVLRQVLDAARWAPSAVNNQPWQFVVVTQPDLRARLGCHARYGPIRWRHVATAPVVVVILANPTANRWYILDCAFAGQNLMLAAHALGLGTCWIGAFNTAGVKEVLAIPQGLKVVGLVTLGYPAEQVQPPPRLDLDQIVFRETYPPRGGPGPVQRLGRAGLFSLRKRLWRR